MANVTVTSAAPAPSGTQQSYGGAMAMVTTLFFMWGFLTCLNDILIPHLKAIFDLNYAQVMLIQFAFFAAYFLFSLPSGKVIEWFGYKRTMVTGLCTMGVGALLFIPAASLPSYPLFLAALMVLAGGMTLLQVSANPYVAVLGPAKGSSSRLNLTQAFNSLGTFIAPHVGSALILTGTFLTAAEMKLLTADQLHAYRIEQASSVKLPYIGFAVVLLLLALVISFYKLPVIQSAEPHRGELAKLQDSLWKHKNLVLGSIGIFVYVGAEVSIGSFLVNYFTQPEIGGLTAKVAAGFVAIYWGGAMVGRFFGSAVLGGAKAAYMALAAVGGVLFFFLTSWISTVAVPSGSGVANTLLRMILAVSVSARPLFALVAAAGTVLAFAAALRGGRLVVKTGLLLGICSVCAAVLVAISMVSTGHVAMWSILLVGFFNSIMFPSIFTLGIDGLGKLTSRGSAILIAAIVGGAIVPELQGLLADRIGIHHAFILPVLCYIYIVYFASATHEIGQNPHAEAAAH